MANMNDQEACARCLRKQIACQRTSPSRKSCDECNLRHRKCSIVAARSLSPALKRNINKKKNKAHGTKASAGRSRSSIGLAASCSTPSSSKRASATGLMRLKRRKEEVDGTFHSSESGLLARSPPAPLLPTRYNLLHQFPLLTRSPSATTPLNQPQVSQDEPADCSARADQSSSAHPPAGSEVAHHSAITTRSVHCSSSWPGSSPLTELSSQPGRSPTESLPASGHFHLQQEEEDQPGIDYSAIPNRSVRFSSCPLSSPLTELSSRSASPIASLRSPSDPPSLSSSRSSRSGSSMDSQEAAWWSEIIPDNTSLSTTVLRSQTVSSFLQDFGKRYVAALAADITTPVSHRRKLSRQFFRDCDSLMSSAESAFIPSANP
ncbi:hypothetical protein PGTUg99_030086 [Puccinia graminis f. sp. tritici]|uniref:Zn(2)-C6 fungal-type domain-containing protein n=1 Tax=Puccinia graminis f. sp. tritici TaxID=56615 RepID=A0A5B0R7K1_PUCGR|nr:hypothetical protein PGTUg99_030086 [Puccinia graminis f. sp. tritici]